MECEHKRINNIRYICPAFVICSLVLLFIISSSWNTNIINNTRVLTNRAKTYSNSSTANGERYEINANFSSGLDANFTKTKSNRTKLDMNISAIQRNPNDKYNSSQPCTFGLFREVNSRDHYYPQGGRWVETGDTLHYQPMACKFKYPRMPAQVIDQCLVNSRIRSVLVMGDSTASRHFAALVKASKYKCRTVRREKSGNDSFMPDAAYFKSQVKPEVAKYLQVRFRYCSGCPSRQFSCWPERRKQDAVRFEYLSQTMLFDDSLQITFPNFRIASPVYGRVWSLSSQEFAFRYFLAGRYPDIFIIFLPMVHAKHNIRLEHLSSKLEYYKSLVRVYFPNTTKLVFMPAYSEFETARGNNTWKSRTYEGMLAAAKVNAMNKILYRVLEHDLLDPDSNVLSFLDLFEASLPHAAWCTDGVHMKPIWYDNVMTMFWETLCNSVKKNDF